ncbi:hypothetical protein C3Y87_09885 [Carbonactinospora thermoautotrophica]|nr:hypothetical protein [Carbonactinospora thermoautotrophica]
MMQSAETEATVEYVRDTMPDARISFRDVYYKIERDGLLEFDMAQIGERLGRDIDTDLFLVSMASYYGRMDVSDGMIRIYSEIQPERFRE